MSMTTPPNLPKADAQLWEALEDWHDYQEMEVSPTQALSYYKRLPPSQVGSLLERIAASRKLADSIKTIAYDALAETGKYTDALDAIGNLVHDFLDADNTAAAK